MTKNQLQYWADLETKRHNEAMEKQAALDYEERKRSNLANERLTSSSQGETKRANLAREAETNRANVAHEANQLLQTQLSFTAQMDRNEKDYSVGVTRNSNDYAIGMRNADIRDAELSQTKVKDQGTILAQQNSSPWSSIATTIQKIIPRAADAISTWVTDLKSVKATKPVPVKNVTIQPVAGNLKK